MNRPEITLILARAANGVIGADGRMPWHLPADLRRFKQLMETGEVTTNASPSARKSETPAESHI